MRRVRGALKEAVFSSSEDRIRATQATISVDGPSIASRAVRPASDPRWFHRATESLFSVLFPSDCRICGLPLLNISRLPVCPDCLAAIEPIQGNICSICGERVLSSYAICDDEGICRCPVCRRIDRPFERAVAYGSYDGGLRELVHLLKFHGVRPAADVLGRMLAEPSRNLNHLSDPEKVLVIPVPLYHGNRSGGAGIQSGGDGCKCSDQGVCVPRSVTTRA